MLRIRYTTTEEAPELKANIDDNAGIDLYVGKIFPEKIEVFEEFTSLGNTINFSEDKVSIFISSPGTIVKVITPYRFMFPKGIHGLVFGRSGNFFKKGIDVFKGVIDSSYRGNVGVGLIFYRAGWYTLTKDTAIAQLVIINSEKYVTVEKVDLKDFDTNTERGENGFGSTGGVVDKSG